MSEPIEDMVRSASASRCLPPTDDTGGGASRERPSRHGKLLGEALAALERAGRRERPDLPEMCATCAFREGCMTNQMAATGIQALNCALGIDTDRFACHHGMTDGEPTRLCAGYITAILAPFDVTREVLAWLTTRLDSAEGPDEIRAEFDGWIAQVDPDNAMDDYQRGRAFLRARSEATPAVPSVGEGKPEALPTEPNPAAQAVGEQQP